jgi:hypothetical protein
MCRVVRVPLIPDRELFRAPRAVRRRSNTRLISLRRNS